MFTKDVLNRQYVAGTLWYNNTYNIEVVTYIFQQKCHFHSRLHYISRIKENRTHDHIQGSIVLMSFNKKITRLFNTNYTHWL